MKAMILAAGLGTRMHPLSRDVAKPALPVLDVPLCLRMVRQLAACGIDEIVLNAHAHPESLERALRDAPVPVRIEVERELRGSGGGIRGARRWLDGPEPILVVNADMVVDLDLAALLERHRAAGAAVTLALRDDPRKRDFGSIGYDARGDVCRITQRYDAGGERGSGLFIGVHVIESRVFDWMPETEAFEILADVYVPRLRAGERLARWLQPAAAAWWPVGSPDELLRANRLALATLDASRIADDAAVAGEVSGRVFIGRAARIEAGARVGPDAVIGAGARVAAGAEVRASLVLPGACVAPGARLDGAIASGKEVWRER